jgi:hypothetical protein
MFLNWVKLPSSDSTSAEQTTVSQAPPPPSTDESSAQVTLPVTSGDIPSSVQIQPIASMHNGKRALITGITGQVNHTRKPRQITIDEIKLQIYCRSQSKRMVRIWPNF